MKRRTLLALSPVAAAPFIAADGLSTLTPTASAVPPSSSVSAEIHLNRWAVVPKVPRPPVLSGRLDDPLWQRAALLDDFRVMFTHAPIDTELTGHLLYGEDALHVGIRWAADAESWGTLTVVDLLVATGSDGWSYHHIPIQISETDRAHPKNYGPGGTLVEGLEPVRSIDAATGTVTAEVTIPFDRIGNPTSGQDTEWRVNLLAQHRMQTRPMSSWTPVRRGTDLYSGGAHLVRSFVANEDCLGSIHLAGGWIDPTAGTQLVDPAAEVTLTWVSFTEKELVIPSSALPGRPRFTVEWKAPGAPWQAVDTAPRTRGDQIVVPITHQPPLTNGIHQIRLTSRRPDSGRGTVPRTVITTDRDALIRAGIAHINQGGQ